jgi:HD-GYP domain-containing protein (c-di-GMP phosphodiesterase class II)
VAEYASELARYVGLPKGEVDLVYITGTLHDVGKIGVPDAILQKEGRLTAEERAIIETHPVLGEIIVRKAPQLAPTLPGVRYHHERWDGLGYPDRLSGKAIPYLARILAVADTFDAMTSNRPYRAGMPRDRALEEINRSAGTQFDSDLARAFVTMMRAPSVLARAA